MFKVFQNKGIYKQLGAVVGGIEWGLKSILELVCPAPTLWQAIFFLKKLFWDYRFY